MTDPNSISSLSSIYHKVVETAAPVVRSKWFAGALLISALALGILGGIGTFASPGNMPMFLASMGCGGSIALLTLGLLGIAGSMVLLMRHSLDTRLHAAAKSGQSDTIQKLLTRGCHINTLDQDNRNPLHYAKDGATVRLLIEKGATYTTVDTDGNTPLHRAIFDGRIETAEALIDLKKSELYAKNNQGQTPLHCAVLQGNASLVGKLLMKSKQEINVVDRQNQTPLHCAGSFQMIKMLLGAGADPNIQNSNRETFLHICRWISLDDMSFMLTNYANIRVDIPDKHAQTCLTTALRIGHADEFKYFKLLLAHYLKNNGNINALFLKSKSTLLHLIIEKAVRDKLNCSDLIRFFIGKGADPNMQDANGITPHMLAGGHSEILNILKCSKAVA